MTDQSTPTPAKDPTEDRSVRPVIEHALTTYGYSPTTVQTLLDRLTSEARAE